jgi:hypothetical protein
MQNKLKRLLILSCSERKSEALTCPAIDRYLSPAFYVVRRYLKARPDNNLVIWILSAKYGLMNSSQSTAHYELALSAERAAQLAEKITRQFQLLTFADFEETNPSAAFCHLPKNYQIALAEHIALIRQVTKVGTAAGRPGEKLQQLKNWLEGK